MAKLWHFLDSGDVTSNGFLRHPSPRLVILGILQVKVESPNGAFSMRPTRSTIVLTLLVRDNCQSWLVFDL